MKKILLMFIAIMPALAYGMGQEDEAQQGVARARDVLVSAVARALDEAGEAKEVVRPRMTTGLGRNVPPYYGPPAKKICGWVYPNKEDQMMWENWERFRGQRAVELPHELPKKKLTSEERWQIIDALLQEGKEERDEFIRRDMENYRKQRDQQ